MIDGLKKMVELYTENGYKFIMDQVDKAVMSSEQVGWVRLNPPISSNVLKITQDEILLSCLYKEAKMNIYHLFNLI